MKSREKIYSEMEGIFGLVPTFFTHIPDTSLEAEWECFKRVQLDDGTIPQKYRELIAVGVAAALRCQFCAFFHTEMAKLHGATQAEIEEAVHFAKNSAGWSTYIHGLQMDFEQFKEEISEVVEHVRAVGAV